MGIDNTEKNGFTDRSEEGSPTRPQDHRQDAVFMDEMEGCIPVVPDEDAFPFAIEGGFPPTALATFDWSE